MNQVLTELRQNILGGLSVGFYLSAFFFSFLGILIMLYADSRKRDPGSQNTPVAFRWSFLIWDNAKRIVVGMAVMFLFYRFSATLIGRAISMEAALGIGIFVAMGVDKAINVIKDKFDWLCMPREKYMKKLLEKSVKEIDNVVP